MRTISGMIHLKVIFSFLPDIAGTSLVTYSAALTILSHNLYRYGTFYVLYKPPKIRSKAVRSGE
jgi:hypothetical protein